VATIVVLPSVVKAIERSYPLDACAGATARAGAGASSVALPTTLFGSARTIPPAIRYFASIGCVHSYTSRSQPFCHALRNSVADRAWYASSKC
jgi:hypothetical protein